MSRKPATRSRKEPKPRRSAINLKSMDLNELSSLQAKVHAALEQRRVEIRAQLERLEGKPISSGKGGRKTLKGRKIAPKFRGPNGETWSGRGAQPRWLRTLLSRGHIPEEFRLAA
jgi:DNA-binding protein H-NS